MIKNYIKTAFRNIRRKPVYSAINILGLATGLACCVLILIYLQYQLSFDSFQKNSENLYRLNKIVTPKTGGTELDAITGGLMGPQLKRDYPEVKEVVRIRPWFDDVLLSRDDDHLKVPQFVLADSSFFKVFGFELLEGNPNTALAKPLSIVLSKKVATHFFGDQNPIGKTIKGLNDLNYTVTGVAENAPINSHIDYDVLVSWTSTGPSALDFGWMNRWLTQVVFTYVQLGKNTDASRLEAKFPKFMKTHFPERSDQYKLYLQPFNKIYLHSSDIHYDDELRSGSITNVYIFTAVALLVLLIACINFVNLTTARSVERGREVGVRKVLGAQRSQLGFQYLGESLGLSFLAMIVALVFIQYGEPILTYMGVPAQQATLWGNHFDILLELAIITIATGLISGIYPAVILSGFKPADTLYGKGTGKWRDDHSIRKVLVTLQFSLSIVLIIGSLIVYQQMKYLNSKDLGFQKKQILVLPLGDAGLQSKAKVFKDRVLNSTDVQEATISSTLPGYGFSSYGINPEGKAQDESWTTDVLRLSDDDFLSTFGMKMESGRFFSDNYASDDSTGVVINEALARSLGWNNPVGKRLDVPGELDHGRVIGVVRDFNTKSLYTKVDPLLMFKDNRDNYLSLKVNPKGLDQTLSFIRKTWESFDSGYPFEYDFLDQKFASFYTSVHKMQDVLFLLTGLAIFVSCLGLFGLSAFVVTKRQKEVGIRKVLGSSVSGVIILISRDFLKLVGIGFLVAVPAAYWLANNWLQDFAYRISIGADVFLLSGIIALSLAILAVIWQSIRAALVNPVESLKCE